MTFGFALMTAFAIWVAVSLYEERQAAREEKRETAPEQTRSTLQLASRTVTVIRAQEDDRVLQDQILTDLERLINLPAYKGRGH